MVRTMVRGAEREGYADMEIPVPQACTLPTLQQPLRLAEWDSLIVDAVQDVQRPESGWLRLYLAPGQAVETRTRDLASREAQCCSFFSFRVTCTAGQVRLDVRVPAAHTGVLDGVERRARMAQSARFG